MDDRTQSNAGNTDTASEAPKAITTSIFDFQKLRRNDYLYVDKTALIHRLFLGKEGQYFLARPRRFGKTLLISTLKAIFQGRRELFKGLVLDSLGYDWTEYPVIHLHLGSMQVENAAELKAALQDLLEIAAAQNGVPLRNLATLGLRFQMLIEDVARTSPTGTAVLLVDEYDKPLLKHLGQEGVTEIRDVLKAFYSAIKESDASQHFALITGVSKFAKVSIFSDLNNLTDLTMAPRAATLLGYTHAELRENFGPHVAAYAEANGMTTEEAYADLEAWYDGYRFHHKAETVFNPVSIGMCLANRERANYWFETGTTTSLVELLKKDPIDLSKGIRLPGLAFSAYEPKEPSLPALIYQTGYLTIKGYDGKGDMPRYTLDFPNREVKLAFGFHLAKGLSGLKEADTGNALDAIVAAVSVGNVGGMLTKLRVFFAGIPYDIFEQKENYYQLLFFEIFTLIGADIETEVRTNTGRIDAVLKTADKIFLFEFKLNGTVEEAMAQIRERRYYEKYLDDGRELVLVGVAFDKETRNIGKWAIAAPPATVAG